VSPSPICAHPKNEQRLSRDAQRTTIEAWARREHIRGAVWCLDQGVRSVSPIPELPPASKTARNRRRCADVCFGNAQLGPQVVTYRPARERKRACRHGLLRKRAYDRLHAATRLCDRLCPSHGTAAEHADLASADLDSDSGFHRESDNCGNSRYEQVFPQMISAIVGAAARNG
jgi:hypothetical protein